MQSISWKTSMELTNFKCKVWTSAVTDTFVMWKIYWVQNKSLKLFFFPMIKISLLSNIYCWWVSSPLFNDHWSSSRKEGKNSRNNHYVVNYQKFEMKIGSHVRTVKQILASGDIINCILTYESRLKWICSFFFFNYFTSSKIIKQLR